MTFQKWNLLWTKIGQTLKHQFYQYVVWLTHEPDEYGGAFKVIYRICYIVKLIKQQKNVVVENAQTLLRLSYKH